MSRPLRAAVTVLLAAALATVAVSMGLTPRLRHAVGAFRHRGGQVAMPALSPAGAGCRPRWSPPTEVGTLPGDRREVSGFVSSPRHPDLAWMVRDSGNPATLYSFEMAGGAVRSQAFPVVGAGNGDWEDIAYTTAADQRGHLWILDNINKRTSPKTLYDVLEPDPETDRTATVAGRYRWEYPDNGGNHDSEVLFALGGRLVVVTKTTPGRVYRFEAPLDPVGMNRPVFAGTLPEEVRVAAGSVSVGERFLVVSSPKSDTVSVYENLHTPPDLAGFLGRAPRFVQPMTPAQREAGGFFPAGGCDIVVVSEQEKVWLLRNL